MIDAELRANLGRHARFTTEIRTYFAGRGYVEVETPTLAPFLIPEPAIEVFQTEYHGRGGHNRDLWLIPSPELWMKRLLGQGSGNIFQISRSFRNGDSGSPTHNPEFRLLEWYTVGSGYRDSIDVMEGLFSHLLSAGCQAGSGELSPPFARLSMQEAFRRYAGIDLSLCQDVGSLVEAARIAGVTVSPPCTWEEAFHIVFLTSVEPSLPRGKPLVLLDYPALVPTTARRAPGAPWAERWELLIDGIEIANCYTEETDRNRLDALLRTEQERKKSSRVLHSIDTGLASAFPQGFPEVTGTALGVDRLEMVFSGEKTLEGVILFPFSDIVR
ncbi:MAG TPA: amino acid--tRNA ligase-related protein [Spirochaetia bacterium]|nr:amino acid--tRNA ligase-related protein [Spirochaetia bacterium]